MSGTPLPKDGKKALAETLPAADLQMLTVMLGDRAIVLDAESPQISAKDSKLGPTDAFLISKWMQADMPKETLTAIHLSGCLISGSRNMAQAYAEPRYEFDTDLSGLQSLLSAIEALPNVRTLDMGNNLFGDEAVLCLTSSLDWDSTKLEVRPENIADFKRTVISVLTNFTD